MTFKELRESSGMTRQQFADHFKISYRTIQNWELGERTCPAYLFELMKYKLDNERAKRESPYITFR
jgi:DNA-binding transcriptional regulator YiaG